MAAANDPGREIALLALNDPHPPHRTMLVEVIEYAFDQLCWTASDPEIYALVASLKAKLDAAQ